MRGWISRGGDPEADQSCPSSRVPWERPGTLQHATAGDSPASGQRLRSSGSTTLGSNWWPGTCVRGTILRRRLVARSSHCTLWLADWVASLQQRWRFGWDGTGSIGGKKGSSPIIRQTTTVLESLLDVSHVWKLSVFKIGIDGVGVGS